LEARKQKSTVEAKMGFDRILVVDDDEDIRMIAEMSLGEVGGWQVRVAESGRRALELALEHAPDVILLDFMMPGMSGKDTFFAFAANPKLSGVPVIFLTARAQKSEVEALVNMGARGVIPKPFDPMTLSDEIRGMLEPT
jgi:two-component system, OmpR family, response regulator